MAVALAPLTKPLPVARKKVVLLQTRISMNVMNITVISLMKRVIRLTHVLIAILSVWENMVLTE